MTGKLNADAPVLIPNETHKSFSRTGEIIPKNTEVTGHPKLIKGLRRGEPFEYKLFLTDNNKLIHLKKITMNETETTMGADSQVTPTVVNIPLQSRLAKPSSLLAIAGAIAGFGYCKYKKHDKKKMAIYTIVGGVIGYAVGIVIENTKKPSVKTSK